MPIARTTIAKSSRAFGVSPAKTTFPWVCTCSLYRHAPISPEWSALNSFKDAHGNEPYRLYDRQHIDPHDINTIDTEYALVRRQYTQLYSGGVYEVCVETENLPLFP